jgi:hypothetical protein
MTEQTREQKEAAIKMVSLAMWGAIIVLIVLAVLFYSGIIPSESGKLVAMAMVVVAVADVVVVKFLVAKMRAGLDTS